MPTTYAIPNGASVMSATLYNGMGSNLSVNNAVNGIFYQPDFVWIKNRNSTQSNCLYDSVRGATQQLNSNNTGAEGTYAGVSSFNAGGFSVGTADNNTANYTYVAWQWKAGGTSVPNTNGSITSQISANTTAGFSVVTYTGNGSTGTVGHGLGVAPQMIIVKRRSATQDWIVAHIGIGGTGGMGNNFMYLNLTDGTSTYSGCFNNTLPTTSVFSVGSDTSTNASGSTYVAYCYAPVAGYSAFGNYVGNGSTDGTFVYTGFRPRWLLIKRTTVESWILVDSSRDPYNVVSKYMLINTSNAEADGVAYDFVSNGIKFRGTSQNQSGATYIYTAFAENPLKFANAR